MTETPMVGWHMYGKVLEPPGETGDTVKKAGAIICLTGGLITMCILLNFRAPWILRRYLCLSPRRYPKHRGFRTGPRENVCAYLTKPIWAYHSIVVSFSSFAHLMPATWTPPKKVIKGYFMVSLNLGYIGDLSLACLFPECSLRMPEVFMTQEIPILSWSLLVKRYVFSSKVPIP